MAEIEKASEDRPTTWNPFRDLDLLSRRLGMLGDAWPDLRAELDKGFTPPVDIEETEDAWTLELELPGVEKKAIDLQTHGRTVVVTGERKEKERTGVMRRKERVTGRFRYEVTLPGEFDNDSIEAKLDNGELSVRLPKTAADQPRKVKIT